MAETHFFISHMPATRDADYHLGYMQGSVILDFKSTGHEEISLIRASFDGYGCYDLPAKSIAFDADDSMRFKSIIRDEPIKEQHELLTLVRKIVAKNKELLSIDALTVYSLA